MKRMNFFKYCPFPAIQLPDRQWPNRTIQKAPIWCSVDLRDGNQALQTPMNLQEKLQMFDLLVALGFKEIEIGFPSASQIEYDFARMLIEENRIPSDVTVQVLVQAREGLIRQTYQALKGVKQAIIHLYNSTSTLQRDVVFGLDRAGIRKIAVEGAGILTAFRQEFDIPGIRFEYSPESFTGTELDYALEVCHAVMEVVRPTAESRLILNLPATVEMATSNVYADQIEWMCRHVAARESVIISTHTHNDRGTAVAAAESALMAGADRVEGTLFGNGERTGNMDIVTMALNLFSQGIDPELDFSRINHVRGIYEKCTRMEVPDRHPYAGELVYTAFSGSHQDAINKGMKAQKERSHGIWAVPYLPIDPQDVGRSYEKIIRINSQSGKGGVAYIMEQEFGFKLPKAMHPEFGRLIQRITDQTGKELSPSEIFHSFETEYLMGLHPYQLRECHLRSDSIQPENSDECQTTIKIKMGVNGSEIRFESAGNGPIDAFVKGLRPHASIDFVLGTYEEHAIGVGSDSRAVAYVSVETDCGNHHFGIGLDPNISVASIKAIVSALNRCPVDELRSVCAHESKNEV